ncbi:hypothetical protein BC938DRAFT_472918 [Jimgerdemannia flammicorona]|uniref:Uncharacterized protein n=1 Tax=Jimgerdemannia flammicorona TaxID=994334 RepID=A0A433Q555_9FUNG|nr:hypothetical protein BC938DRAFT_472918 [Jimgerdemannia flammicorona]
MDITSARMTPVIRFSIPGLSLTFAKTAYCALSGGTTTIKNHLSNASQKFKDAVSDLVDRKPIKYILSDNMSYGDLAAHDDRALWTLLYYAGYLTIRDGQFVVPNSEVYISNATQMMEPHVNVASCGHDDPFAFGLHMNLDGCWRDSRHSPMQEQT